MEQAITPPPPLEAARQHLAGRIVDLDTIIASGEAHPEIVAKHESFFIEAQRARNTAHGLLTALCAVEQLFDEVAELGKGISGAQ